MISLRCNKWHQWYVQKDGKYYMIDENMISRDKSKKYNIRKIIHSYTYYKLRVKVKDTQ
jgi:hypothetical protein